MREDSVSRLKQIVNMLSCKKKQLLAGTQAQYHSIYVEQTVASNEY